MMARPAHVYPQVEPGARGLVNAVVATTTARATVRSALDVARQRDAVLVTVGTRHVLRTDLARAAALELMDLDAASLARPLPVVDARASEVAVRRHFRAGAPVVIVRGGGRIVGAVERGRPPLDGVPTGVRMALALRPAMAQTLVTIGELASSRGAHAFVVGGIVRDALLGRDVPGDIDIVIDGDGPGVARDLAERRGTRLVEHPAFLTASIEGDAAPDGIGRVDVATARVERYEARGALPRVRPARIIDDLERRDFTVNAMAVELHSGGFALLDPFGGRADLAARRLRILHPLSFVEDPTRMFRAARYAARLGLRPDAWTLAAQRLALSLVPYPRLSGQRLVGEIDRIVSEPTAGDALARLGATAAFRLLDPRYRYTRRAAARVRALGDTLAWCRLHGVEARPVDLAIVAVLSDQAPDVAVAACRRLALAGETLARVNAALALGVHAPAARLATSTPSARVAFLRSRSALELAWLWLIAEDAVRRALEWYVAQGRDVTAGLRGEDVIALGVPRGPEVARMLARLTDARLDGIVRDPAGERAYVRALLGGGHDGSEDHGIEGTQRRREE